MTADDERLLLETAQLESFEPGDTILEEGSRRQTLFILEKGAARVERSHLGAGIAVARLGAGALFGEMSFLENAATSAAVVAEQKSDVARVEGPQVLSLIASVPGFGTRFYQSLAVLLSERLRETVGLLPPLLVEDIPQVNRFHARRASRSSADDVPPKLIELIEEFKIAMATADRAIATGNLEGAEAQAFVSSACQAVSDGVSEHVKRESHLEEMIGAFVFRETFAHFMQSPFIDRSFSKPRGYAGDYETIELIYRNEPVGHGRLAPRIDRWALDFPGAVAVRNRRTMMTSTIRELAAATAGTFRLTSLASGPARELFDLFTENSVDATAVCIDIDPEALATASREAEQRGLSDKFLFAQENVIRLIRGRGNTQLEPQHLIYSLGLIDYLPDELAVLLLDWIHDNLVPGGTAVIGNFDPSDPGKAFMDHIAEWKLIYRDADHLKRLYQRSKFDDGEVDVRHESAGVQLFAFARR